MAATSSSHDAPTSVASCAWRSIPPAFRAVTETTMRTISWVLRSRACSDSICESQARCASCRAGNASCNGFSYEKLHSDSSPSATAVKLPHRPRPDTGDAGGGARGSGRLPGEHPVGVGVVGSFDEPADEAVGHEGAEDHGHAEAEDAHAAGPARPAELGTPRELRIGGQRIEGEE